MAIDLTNKVLVLRNVRAVTVSVAHEAAVLVVDYMRVEKGEEVIEKIRAVLLTDFFKRFPRQGTVIGY